MEAIVTIIAPKNAGQKPSTEKPLTKVASQNTNAFITSKNKPRVSMLKGAVSTFSGMPTSAFSIAKTTATKSAVQKLATVMPGTSSAAIITPMAVSNKRKIIFIKKG